MTLLAHLKWRKYRERYIYRERFILKPRRIRAGTMHFNHPGDKTFAARPHQRSSFLAIDGIQSRKPSSLAGIQPLFFSSFLFLHLPLLFLIPLLQRCWPARNSTSPLNNGGTLTIFAAVYQDLDPNGSLGEYVATFYVLLPSS